MVLMHVSHHGMMIDEKMPTDTIKGYKVSLMAKDKGIYLQGDSNTKQNGMHHSLSTWSIVNAD